MRLPAVLFSNFGIVAVGVLGILVSCVSQGRNDASLRPPDSNLARFITADPVADSQKAIRTGDMTFLAVSGVADDVPGIPHFKSRYSGKYRYRIIAGTSEFVSGLEDIRLQESAAAYAARYNRCLMNYLQSREKKKGM